MENENENQTSVSKQERMVNIVESKESNSNLDAHSELIVGLSKLKNHLKNDKKFNRAVLILITMINQSLNSSNSSSFYDCITEFMSESQRDVMDVKYRSFYVDLFDVINSKMNEFKPQHQYRLISFSLYCHTRSKLLTDDSYLFTQEIKKDNGK